MFIRQGTVEFGSGKLCVAASIREGRLIATIANDGLIFDSRFVPPRQRASKDVVVLLAITHGHFEALEPTPTRRDAPVCLRMSEADFEGDAGRRVMQFRTYGAPYRALHVRVHRSALCERGPRAPGPIALTPDAWTAARRLADRAEGVPPVADDFRRWLDALRESGVLQTREIERPPAARLARVWSVIAPRFAAMSALSTLDELALEASVSTRTIARDVRAFLRTYPFLSESWREFTVRVRIKLAVQGLSAADVSIGEVAERCGYGSSDAMARTFRDAGLPTPTTVRDALRADAEALAKGPTGEP